MKRIPTARHTCVAVTECVRFGSIDSCTRWINFLLIELPVSPPNYNAMFSMSMKRNLRVTKWLGKIPAVAVCTFCDRLFAVPMTALKRAGEPAASIHATQVCRGPSLTYNHTSHCVWFGRMQKPFVLLKKTIDFFNQLHESFWILFNRRLPAKFFPARFVFHGFNIQHDDQADFCLADHAATSFRKE